LITGFGWVSELIEIAGGDNVFPDLTTKAAARDRIVRRKAVAAAAPDLILASWCGKRVVPQRIASRPGWQTVWKLRLKGSGIRPGRGSLPMAHILGHERSQRATARAQ
jgi:iron complex transport system substrate-binding protein